MAKLHPTGTVSHLESIHIGTHTRTPYRGTLYSERQNLRPIFEHCTTHVGNMNITAVFRQSVALEDACELTFDIEDT